jgi:hypothetical protein
MSEFFLFIVLSLTVARTTRLITEDTILDEPRQWILKRIWGRGKPDDIHESSWTPPYWQGKLHYLLTCPWCCSIWVSAGALGATYLFTDYSIPAPWFWWPALAMLAVIFLEWTDGEKLVQVRLKK